jgi:hypothetical protein
MKRRTVTLLVATIVASAAHADYRVAVANAQILVGQKQFAKALEVINAAEPECGAGPDAEVCRANIYFTRGYIHASNDELEPAAAEYRKMLEIYPENVAARSNLADVLSRSGKAEDAAKELATAAKFNPSSAGELYYSAAETLTSAGEYKRAVEYYKYATATSSPDAPQGLVSCLARWLASEKDADDREDILETTLDIGHDLRRRGSTGAATSAYELVMQYRKDAGAEHASEALFAWTEARATTRSLTRMSLAALPSAEQWDSPFLQSLRKTVAEEKWSFDADALKSDFARYSAASAAQTVADELVAEKELARATELYRQVMTVAPTPAQQEQHDELQWRPAVYLDAALQLGRISTSTHDDALFTEIEKTLFNNESALFAGDNSSAAQRAHSVVGAIYAERQSPAAIGHFEAALRIAEEREKKDRVRQTLPQVHMRLAESYRAKQDFLTARKHEIAAAQDYLDLDALGAATLSLDRAKDGPAPAAEDAAAIRTLQVIAGYRAIIPKLRSMPTGALPAWELALAPGSPIDDPDFLERQTFKASADLANQAARIGNQQVAARFYTAALAQAKQNTNLLQTPSDKLRYWQSENALESKPGRKKDPGKLWQVGLDNVDAININDVWLTVPISH